MSVEIAELDPETDADEWNRYVERSPGANPLHRAESLAVQAAHTGTDVAALAGFKGQEAVGLFPVFEYARGPISAAFSPPPYSWVSYLGPAMVNVAKLKRRKRDRRTRRFVEGCLAWIDEEISPYYTRIVGEFDDARPFRWNGHDVTPGYTYVVSLEGCADEADLIERFSSDARRNVRNADPDDYVVREGDGDDVERIVEQVRDRYESQGKSFHMDSEFARELYERLPDGSIRPYVCRVDGDVLGGILVVESDDTRYRWQGGVTPGADVDLPVNDLLDWTIMRDGLREGVDRYDLVGAGVPSINRYKAKFNPELRTHYEITDGTLGVHLLIDQYRKFR